MSSISREQRDVLALIDAIMAMTEKAPKSPYLGVGISLNPFTFLMDIITKYVSFEEMVDWLVDVLTVSLPTIELSIKGVILANLKATIDCNNDPRIPNWLRKNGAADEGFIFDLRAIDYNNIMSVSPLSEHGKAHYFGTSTYFIIDGDKESGKKYHTRTLACKYCIEQGLSMTRVRKYSDCDNVYQLARAEDFNAYLWFVVNKCYFTKEVTLPVGSNLLGVISGTETLTENIASYSPGAIATSTTINSLCIEGKVEEYNGQYGYTNSEILTNDVNVEMASTNFLPRSYNYKFVPMSKDTKSVNWYVNRETFYNFLKKEKDRVPRDYGKEVPICNLQYYENIGHSMNCIKFTILRKPEVHLPSKDEPIWRVKPIIFDKDGNPDIWGSYSSTAYAMNDDGSYTLTGGTETLYECYPRLTVYEFNYDYVMGMKLFDPTVVTAQLLETVINFKFHSRNENRVRSWS